jgi:transposase-like protein
MHRAEVITVERRRRWSWTDKQQIVEETLMPGASLSAVARRYGLHPSQLFAWRKAVREGDIEEAGCGSLDCVFAPVLVSGRARMAPPVRSGAVGWRSCLAVAAALWWTPVSMRRRSTALSMCWNGDDHAGVWHARVAGGWAHRHAQGFDGLSALVQQKLAQDPFCGHLFVFRGRRGERAT